MEQAWKTHARDFILKILKDEELLNKRLMIFFQGKKIGRHKESMGHTEDTSVLYGFELSLKGGRDGNYVIAFLCG